jgi:ankyrin repeat protein
MSQNFLNIVRSGTPDEIRAAVEANPEIAQTRDAQGVSALMWAIYSGRRDVRDYLLSGLRTEVGGLDVFEASACADCDCLRTLLGEDALRARAVSGDGWTPLHLAAAFGDAAAVCLLLEHGAHVHQISHNPMRNQPLHACLSLGRDRETVRILIECGANVHQAQSGGFTPLHQAVVSGDAELVAMLLEAGADKSARSDDGKTPADYARERGHLDIAEMLD